MAESFVCKAAANLRGEHIPCDHIETQMAPGTTSHTGWAHSNRKHELLWTGDARVITDRDRG